MTTIISLVLIFSIVYTFIDSWTNEKIIRNEKAARKKAAAFNMVLVWFLIVFFAFYPTYIDPLNWKSFIYPAIVFTIPFFTRYALFDIILNKLMGWKWNFTGTTSTIDKLKIPFWVRFVLLAICLVLVFSLKSQIYDTTFYIPENTTEKCIYDPDVFPDSVLYIGTVKAYDKEGDLIYFSIAPNPFPSPGINFIIDYLTGQLFVKKNDWKLLFMKEKHQFVVSADDLYLGHLPQYALITVITIKKNE